jgi:hypothetical protein
VQASIVWFPLSSQVDPFLTASDEYLANFYSDMVPIREVASWRSYVNIAATSGRSLGGPIGGYLIDTIGWRWFVTHPSSFSSALKLRTQQVIPRTMSSHSPRSCTCSVETQTNLHRRAPRTISTLQTPTNRLPGRHPLIAFHHLWSPRARAWRKTYAFHTPDDSFATSCFTCYRKFVSASRRIRG